MEYEYGYTMKMIAGSKSKETTLGSVVESEYESKSREIAFANSIESRGRHTVTVWWIRPKTKTE